MVRVMVVPDDDPSAQVVFDNGPQPPAVGMWLVSGGLSGWYGSPAPREKPVAGGGMDGDWRPSTLTQGARTVTLKARAMAETSVELARMLDRVSALACRDLTLLVEDESGTRGCSCYVSDVIDPLVYGSRILADFTLILTAPDPYRYGRLLTYRVSDGGVTVDNPGDLPAWPRLEARGHVTALRVHYGGSTVSWSGDVTGVLRLDLRDMLPSAGTVGSDDGFRLPPGRSVVSVAADAGVDVSVAVRPAWR